jgi:hypothetical protein
VCAKIERREGEFWVVARCTSPVEVEVRPSDGVFLATPAAVLGGTLEVRLTPESWLNKHSAELRTAVPDGWSIEPEDLHRTFPPLIDAFDTGILFIDEVLRVQAPGAPVSGRETLRLDLAVNGEVEEFVYPLWRCDGIDLTGEWRFWIGDDLAWADPDVSDATWDTIQVPGWWEDQGFNDEGWAWYRKTVDIPAEWDGAWSVITSGPVDDEDTLFINGKEIASGKGWKTPRRHVIPPEALRPGKPNLVAIRVKDYYGGGGISEGPVRWIAGPTVESLPDR